MKVNNEDFLNFLYESTFEILESFGSKGWTMDDICKEAGISKDTLYRAISSKDHLVTCAINSKIFKHVTDMEEVVHSDYDYYTRFNQMISLLYEIIEIFSSKQIQSVLSDYPLSSKYASKSFSTLISLLEEFLSQGITIGILRHNLDISFLAKHIHNTILHIIEKEKPKSYERYIESYFDILMNGIKSDL